MSDEPMTDEIADKLKQQIEDRSLTRPQQRYILLQVERLRAVIAEQQAEIAAMRPIVAFVKNLVQYPGMAKSPRDLLAQAEDALAPMRAYVAQHATSDEPNGISGSQEVRDGR